MAESANLLLLDELIRHQVYVERFKRGQLLDLQRFLGKLLADVTGQLGEKYNDVTEAKSARQQKLEKLLKDIGQLSDQVSTQMSDVVQNQLKELAAYESGFLASAVTTVVPVAISFEAVGATQLWAAATARPFEGRLMEQWFKDYTVAQKSRLTEAVRMSVAEGETVDQAIRRVRGTKALNFQDGIVQGINRRGAEALVRTAINHTVTMARQETLVENEGVVKGVTWRSTLDGKTSPICIARDGKVYGLTEGPRPPAHPNCRSTIVPLLKSWSELGIDLKEAPEGTRASMDGQVPESLKYGEWLKRQPRSFQDDVLGPTKAQLFRKGGLTVDKFVDEQLGRGYTLKELRTKYPKAFTQAGL